jgi:hypothetical protein
MEGEYFVRPGNEGGREHVCDRHRAKATAINAKNIDVIRCTSLKKKLTDLPDFLDQAAKIHHHTLMAVYQ